MNRYPHINDIYISDRLKSQLMQIRQYPITLIVAPAGYGKTTALKWWNEYRNRYISDSVFFRLNIMSGDISDFWNDFCRMIGKENDEFGSKMMKIGYPSDGRRRSLLAELWEERHETKETFFVIDDVHLLPSDEIAPLFVFIENFMPENVHFVLLSRSSLFSMSQEMKMGRSLNIISKEALQLTSDEILEYAGKCGLALPDDEARVMESFSGGWISLIYMIFCVYVKSGKWQFATANIDELITNVMIDPLSQREKDFLTVCSVAAEFSEPQAEFLWGCDDAALLLGKLSSENAFIARDSEGIYRYHNLLRRNAADMFEKIDAGRKKEVYKRLGDWHLLQNEYLAAMIAYRDAENWDSLLKTVVLDKGNSIGGSHSGIVKEWYHSCPEDVMADYPEAMLMFELQFFISGDIAAMMKLNGILAEMIEKSSGISKQELDNFEGERQILMGFLKFNNIAGMSVHHRKACGLMSRDSILVNRMTPWTFGAPSITMLYHRESGGLDRENDEMHECMPYYYQLTDGHGNGAEYSMLAETAYLRCDFENAEINYFQAAKAALRKNQYSILITAEMTMMRIEIFRGDYEGALQRYRNLRKTVMDAGSFVLMPTVDICRAWLVLVMGMKELVPEWIAAGDAADAAMGVARPVFMIVQNSFVMHCRKWTEAVAGAEEIRKESEEKNMVLCRIYADIQHAASLRMMGHEGKAVNMLKHAVELAEPDGIIMPFAENGVYIEELAEKMKKDNCRQPFINKILRICKKMNSSVNRIRKEHFGVITDAGLTKRENEIAALAARRMTVKEIAAETSLSENTVKFHLKNIYNKLEITKEKNNKREVLEKYFSDKGTV